MGRWGDGEMGGEGDGGRGRGRLGDLVKRGDESMGRVGDGE